MKHIKFLPYVFAFSFFVSCSDASDEIGDDNQLMKEDEHTSLLISDVNSTTLNFLKPFSGVIEKYQASYSKGAVYATESGRYGVITHRDDNFTETFNVGGEIAHGDHSHDLGETGLAAISFEAQKPTHFKSEHNFVAVYNDGNATLSLFNENSIHNASSPVRTIATGTTAHHGAMVIFKNGTIAVTNLGNGSSLPEEVHVINQLGEVISNHENKIVTSGIHGSAGNDKTAIFGSNTGILVVQNTGEQRIIEYPSDFEDDVWFGALLGTSVDHLFVGYTASKGVYFININNDEVTPIYETSDLFKCMVVNNGDDIVCVTKSGKINVTNVNSKQVIYEGQLNVTMDTVSDGHSAVTSNIDVSENFVYVSIPSQKKIVQIKLENLSVTKEFLLDITPYQFKVLGVEFDH